MRGFAIIVLILLVSSTVSAQEWRDSLAVARDAYSKQEYGKALKYYRSAQNKAPEGVDLSKEMGQSAYKNLQFEEAEKIYREQAFSEKDTKEKAKAYHNLGNSLMKQKKYDEAIDAYKQSLRNDAANDKTRHNLSEAMRLKKEEEQKKEQNQQDNKDQKDQKDQQNNQNNQEQNQQGQNQNNKDQQNQGSQGQKQQSQNQKDKGQSQSQGGSPQLQDKAVEKKLDELMKQESATKRRMGGSTTSSGSSRSGKDW